jgi:hypothetical protein
MIVAVVSVNWTDKISGKRNIESTGIIDFGLLTGEKLRYRQWEE